MKFNLAQEHKQNYLLNWKFWFKLLIGLFLICLIIGMYIKNMIELGALANQLTSFFDGKQVTKEALTQHLAELSKQGWSVGKFMDWIAINMSFGKDGLKQFDFGANFGDYTVNTFSYFTTLSNIAVAVWFILAALQPKNEGKRGYLSYKVTLIVVTYITITMLIYNGLLLPQMLGSGGGLTPMGWFESMTEHVVGPLLFIFYICFFFNVEHKHQNKKSFMIKEWPWHVAILVTYAIYAMVRGEIRYQGDKPAGTQYPYFFLNIHAEKVLGMPGWAWFIIAIILVSGICLGFSMAYHTILDKRSQKQTADVVA
ncbi:Pr6Pr family membrane protein [Williamsoniiplasma lucivorax]|uniref:Uncharacterized protein n=1 Tax=Williamsoniiplasma lucivorax TaxID=209274 RepID=A0A2S5RD94_9MOLU|nr:Pr6Pr family membrane protein [Williamsoniiplasma lucivorax]PPE05182.1 hypothetical protein ELUCI_v1c07180 [Williamsoniiplasma lucivorax]